MGRSGGSKLLSRNPLIHLRDNISQLDHGPYGCMHCGYYIASGFSFVVKNLDWRSAVFWHLRTHHLYKNDCLFRKAAAAAHTYIIHFSHIIGDMHSEIWCCNNPLSHCCTLPYCCKRSQALLPQVDKIKLLLEIFCFVVAAENRGIIR